MHRAVTAAGVTGAVLAVAAALAAAPHQGALALPPGDPGTWAAWLAARPPEDVAFVVVRLATVALLGHGATLVVMAALAGLARRPAAAATVERAAPPGTRAVVRWAAAAGFALATITGPAVAGAAVDGAPPVIRPLGDDPAPVAAPAPAAPGRAPAEWTVQPGDHLWGIAEDTLAGALGRPPTAAEVVPYWLEVIEANRPRLADPANPDLIFPGQVMVVPAVSR